MNQNVILLLSKLKCDQDFNDLSFQKGFCLYQPLIQTPNYGYEGHISHWVKSVKAVITVYIISYTLKTLKSCRLEMQFSMDIVLIEHCHSSHFKFILLKFIFTRSLKDIHKHMQFLQSE